MESLFRKERPEDHAASPNELIEPEIVHLKKGYSIRHGPQSRKTPPWVTLLVLCGLIWLYIMDPVLHAWYKGEAVRAYLYLHNYGAGPEAENLAATGILSLEELATLNRRQGSFQDYFPTPDAANQKARTIIAYMNNVRLLHDGKYQQLNPVGRMRYLFFIRTGLFLPTDWSILDPSAGT
jgi:hypothetical protein